MVIILGIFASVTATVVGVYFLTSNFDQNELKQGAWNISNDQYHVKDITKINETGSDDYDQASESMGYSGNKFPKDGSTIDSI